VYGRRRRHSNSLATDTTVEKNKAESLGLLLQSRHSRRNHQQQTPPRWWCSTVGNRKRKEYRAVGEKGERMSVVKK
jgi:hypothetical protein